MLQSIRDHTQGWIAGIIVSILILSFALWGIHSYFEGNGANDLVAEVNDVPISKGQLHTAYERLRRQAQMQSGNASLPEQAEASLKQEALQTLISLQVLQQASVDDKYRISSDQVNNFLVAMPEFQVDGKFSTVRLQQFLQTTAYNVNDFLTLINTSLLIDQPRLGIILSAFVLPNEMASTLALMNQERNIRYVMIPQTVIPRSSITIPAGKIQTYYDQHQDEFKTAEQASIEYILLSLKNLTIKIKITDAELNKFYAENPSSFTDTKNNKPQTFAEVKEKIRDILTRQRAEEQFADLREKLANLTYEHPESLGHAAQSLGLTVQSTATFSKEKGANDISSDKHIRDVAFSNDVLHLKNNSDVIQLNNSEALVIRVKNYIPAAVLPLATLQNQISEKLKDQELSQRAEQLALDMQKTLQSDGNVDSLLQQYSLKWVETGFIGRGSDKIAPAILAAAFATNDSKSTYTVTKLTNGYAVLTVLGQKQGAGDKAQSDFYNEQAQTTLGLFEYELYKQSLVKQADVTTY